MNSPLPMGNGRIVALLPDLERNRMLVVTQDAVFAMRDVGGIAEHELVHRLTQGEATAACWFQGRLYVACGVALTSLVFDNTGAAQAIDII